jgi:hypothetical protein
MDVALVEQAIELLEKANADLEPELLEASEARRLMTAYSRLGRLVSFGEASLSRKIGDPTEIARLTGSSIGKAKATVVTGKVIRTSDALSESMQHGEISLDQAVEIARAEEASPGAAESLVPVARDEAFHVFKEKARKVKLEAEQHRDLGERQRSARSARSYNDALGMTHIHLTLEPHVGTPIVARAEAEAARQAKQARDEGRNEPFERHLADAYASQLSGSGKGRAKRPELVVLVSHEVARRGWTDVRGGETCKIPGIGPVTPQVAKEIAEDAFLTGVFFDGKDLRHMRRWTRNLPVEVALALELGKPPDFDGVACVDCGNRFRTEFDHVMPHAAKGPASNKNMRPRCWRCHRKKTDEDRRSGRLKPDDP